MRCAVEEEIHLPDISFCRVCENAYGINRGVYNTIDEYFYLRGHRDIVRRRKLILSFLHFIGETPVKLNKKSCYKFGHGGLIEKLDAFTNTRLS